MNPENPEALQTPPTPAPEPDRCDFCGALDAHRIAGRVLCADCQIEAGSACGGVPAPNDRPGC